MVNRLNSRSGFTLMESLMVAAIIGVVVLIGPKVMVNLVRFYNLHTAKIEIQRDARVALDLINRLLRQGKSYTVVIDQATNQPPYSRISFETVSGEDVTFYQKGTELFIVNPSTVAISKNLRYIAFTYPRSDDPTIVSVAITMEKATYQGGKKALELSIEKVRVMN
jgi:prepilin-type N-terminal cleavage/methylation domain-containing protein